MLSVRLPENIERDLTQFCAVRFFIGAHALADGYKLLTRDAGRYKTYFPKIKLICP